MQYLLVCDVSDVSEIFLRRNGDVVCKGELLIIEYQQNFDFSTIDPALVASYFGSGFLLYIVFWAISVGLRSLFSLLK